MVAQGLFHQCRTAGWGGQTPNDGSRNMSATTDAAMRELSTSSRIVKCVDQGAGNARHFQSQAQAEVINALRVAEYIEAWLVRPVVIVFTFHEVQTRAGGQPVFLHVPNGDTIFLRPGTRFVGFSRDFRQRTIRLWRIRYVPLHQAAIERITESGTHAADRRCGSEYRVGVNFLTRHFPEAEFELVEADEANAAVAAV